jgi:hypothetical protein
VHAVARRLILLLVVASIVAIAAEHLSPRLSVARAQDAQPPDDAPAQPLSDESQDDGDEAYETPVPGDPVLLIYTNRQKVEGVLVEQRPGAIVVRIGGIDVTVRPSELDRMVRLPSVAERFRQMRGVLRDNDVRGRIALARWARDRGLFDDAIVMIDEALEIEPTNGEALALRPILEQLRALDERKRARDAAAPDRKPQEQSPDIRAMRILDFPLLSPEEVNLIKVYEVDIADPPRMVVNRDTIDALLQRYAGSPGIPTTRAGREAFRRLPPADILQTMFRLGARELYPEVEVIGNPVSMNQFRDAVHAGWLINACATTRCHGGNAAGRLQLFNRKATNERSFYTNFLILDRYRLETGRPLIDYDAPDRSVLLHMGLAQDDALWPHPEVDGWKPVFRDRRARNFRRAVEWISSMYKPRPDYPITYIPPGAEPSPAPVER